MKRKRSLILLALFICSYSEISEAAKYQISGNQWLGVAAGWNDEVTAKGDVWMDLQGFLGNEAAVYASSNGKIDLSGFNTSIKIRGKGVVGAYAKDKNSSITFSGSVAVEGEGASGIYADSGTIISEGTVTAIGEKAIGIYVENDGAKVNHTGDIVVKGDSAKGIFADRAGSEAIVRGDISTEGKYSHGISNRKGKVDFSGKISTKEKESYGVSNEDGQTIFDAGILTEGEKSHGVHNGIEGGYGIVEGKGSITTKGENSSGFWNSQYGEGHFSGIISTEGDSSHGIVNERNVMYFEGGIHTEGKESHGVQNEEGEVEVSGDIYTTGEKSFGIYAKQTEREEEGKPRYTEYDQVRMEGNISTTGAYSHGIYLEGGDVILGKDPENSSTITTTGDYAKGIYVEKGKADVEGNIFTSGKSSLGIHTALDQSQVDFTGAIFTQGDDSAGIYAQAGKIQIRGEDSMIVTTGNRSDGILIDKGIVDMEGVISTGGDQSTGVKILDEQGKLELQGAIFTSGLESHGVYLENGTAYIGQESEDSQSTIYTMGDQSYGIWNLGGEAKISGEIITEGKFSHGIRNEEGKMEFAGSVMTIGEESHGIYSSGGEVTLLPEVNIYATGEKAYGIYADQGAQINLKGNATIVSSLDSDSYAIRAEKGMEPQFGLNNQQDKTRISGEGQFFITGGISAGDGGDIRLNFKEGSGFEGATEVDSGGFLEMNMKDTYWKITGDSRVSHLSLTGAVGSVVDFRSDAPIGTELVIDNYEKANNHAVFALRADIAKGISDKVIVTDSELDPNTNLMYVEDITTGRIDGNEVITMARIDGDHENVHFGLSTIDGAQIDTVDSGGFRYGLVRDTSNWNLKGTGNASTTASASVNTFAGAYLLSYAENQTLMQRLGDLRNDPSSSGVWFKVHGGEFESRSGSIFDDFKIKYWGVQAGIDKKISSKNKKADIYIGGMFGYSKGDMDYDSHGSGTIEAKTLGFYGTYKRDSGFYADLLLKYMWMDNEFDVINLQGGAIHGDEMSTDGFGASFEIGKRFHFDSQSRSGWYVEPQAQISYLRQNSGDFYASNGLHVNVDSYTSLLGRLGTNIGYEIKSGKNPVNLYAKVSYVYEFDGDVGAELNGAGVRASFGDSWWTYGIGITAKVGVRHNVYLDLERATGGQFKQPWSLNGGYRYSW